MWLGDRMEWMGKWNMVNILKTTELYTFKKKGKLFAYGLYVINKMKQKEGRQWFSEYVILYRSFGATLMFHILQNKIKEGKKTPNEIKIELNESLNFKWII